MSIETSAKRSSVLRRSAQVAALTGGLVLATSCSSGSETSDVAASSSAATACDPGVETATGYCNIVQFETDVFANYENASGITGRLEIGRAVMVLCHVPEQTIGSGEGGWYKLDPSEGELGGDFAPANNFENGDQAGVPINRAFDPDIRDCAPEEIHR